MEMLTECALLAVALGDGGTTWGVMVQHDLRQIVIAYLMGVFAQKVVFAVVNVVWDVVRGHKVPLQWRRRFSGTFGLYVGARAQIVIPRFRLGPVARGLATGAALSLYYNRGEIREWLVSKGPRSLARVDRAVPNSSPSPSDYDQWLGTDSSEGADYDRLRGTDSE